MLLVTSEGRGVLQSWKSVDICEDGTLPPSPPFFSPLPYSFHFLPPSLPLSLLHFTPRFPISIPLSLLGLLLPLSFDLPFSFLLFALPLFSYFPLPPFPFPSPTTSPYPFPTLTPIHIPPLPNGQSPHHVHTPRQSLHLPTPLSNSKPVTNQ